MKYHTFAIALILASSTAVRLSTQEPKIKINIGDIEADDALPCTTVDPKVEETALPEEPVDELTEEDQIEGDEIEGDEEEVILDEEEGVEEDVIPDDEGANPEAEG